MRTTKENDSNAQSRRAARAEWAYTCRQTFKVNLHASIKDHGTPFLAMIAKNVTHNRTPHSVDSGTTACPWRGRAGGYKLRKRQGLATA
eukprot:393421-Pleurochrysis_carterae.AAC.2